MQLFRLKTCNGCRWVTNYILMCCALALGLYSNKKYKRLTNKHLYLVVD